MGDYHAIAKAFSRALVGGATRHSLGHAEWDISLSCLQPIYQSLHAYPPSETGVVNIDRSTRSPLHLELWVPCKKCDVCLTHRKRQWTRRAVTECSHSIRTWFGTLTLRPEEQHRTHTLARQRYAPSGDFDALDYGAQFRRRCLIISDEITRYLKRVRKRSGASLRQLFVAEHHKSGLPHYHCLIHERDLVGVTEDLLRSEWKLGFTKWRLITDRREAAYVCKYLSKSGASRIRASVGYGTRPLDIAAAFQHAAREQMTPQTNLSDLRECAA